jgi:hypothetical protein
MSTAIENLPHVSQFRGRVVDVGAKIKFDLRTLPAISKQHFTTTQLTPHYVAAKKALATLYNVDELKEIADKHIGIAAYAKQLEDASLLHYAERVYLRAIERIGELLREIANLTERRAAAKQFGLRTQTKMRHAVTIAAAPKAVRDAAIEKTPPPTLPELVAIGTRYAPRSPPPVMARKTQAAVVARGYRQLVEDIGCLVSVCDGWKPEEVQLTQDEAAKLLRLLTGPREKLDALEQRLEKLAKRK